MLSCVEHEISFITSEPGDQRTKQHFIPLYTSPLLHYSAVCRAVVQLVGHKLEIEELQGQVSPPVESL